MPPERVVDVMALRGDAIDNIPGAPGIGDKGSVELIQQFGTVEAALDRADEVKKKTYRESLQNNRDNILLSKELVTIHTSVPIEFSLDAMRTQPVDNAACRALFTELEFTTLLKELAPAVDAVVTTYNVKASGGGSGGVACGGAWRRMRWRWRSRSLRMRRRLRRRWQRSVEAKDAEAEAEPRAAAETMSLFGGSL